MCLVSTLPWAITVRLPRFSGGIGWLLALSMSAMLWSSMPTFAAAGESLDLQTRAWAAWSFLVYPAGLVGSDLSGDQALAAAPALTLAIASMIGACRWIARSSIPLEAAQ
jgi:hypothetical protein